MEWMKTEIPSKDIPNLGPLRKRLDNEFGFKETYMNFIFDTIEQSLPHDSPDVIVTKERKGTKIIRNYMSKRDNELNHIPFDLVTREDVEDKDVLIFDDGIHYGETGREIINKICSYDPLSITFLSTIADMTTLEELKKEFQQVHFICHEAVPSESYTITYNRWFCRLFDVMPGPLDNHLVYKIRLTNIEEAESIAKVLNSFDNSEIYQVPTLAHNDSDVIKGTILFDPGNIDIALNCEYKIMMYKIRFYIFYTTNDGIDIIFTPVLQLIDLDPKSCQKDFDPKLCDVNTNMDEKLCLECLEFVITINLFRDFRNKFEDMIREEKIYISQSNLEWDLARKYNISM